MSALRFRLLIACCLALSVGPLPEGQSQSQQPFAGAYKGTLECTQTSDQATHISTQLVILIRNGRVSASTQEFTGAMTTGKIDENGALNLGTTVFTSDATWRINYTGTLNAAGGTLTGTQVLTRNSGEIDTRTCEGTFTVVNEPARKEPRTPQ